MNNGTNAHMLQAVLSWLRNVKGPDPHGNYTALCPFHNDHRNSLSLHREKGARCFSPGCKAYDGISLSSLAEKLSVPLLPVSSFGGSNIEATYDYRDAQGNLLYQVVRLEGKRFSQRRPDGASGWVWNLKGVQRVLYRLPELMATSPDAWVFITEGEKDADNLASLGLVATTNPEGAGKWRPEYSEALRGRSVAILPDNDPPGQAHAQQVAWALKGIAADVRLRNLPGLPPSGDVSEWLTTGGTKEELLKLVEATPDVISHNPLVLQGFSLTRLSTLLSEPEENIPWLWDKTLPAGGLSLLGAKPKVGKSTFARNLAHAVAIGEPFLGRDTAQGPVVYLALEEKRQEIALHFKRMGCIDEPVYVHTGAAPEQALEALRKEIETTGAKLAIVDPLLRMIRLRDSNDYAEVTRALEPLLHIARETGCHILAVHHMGKMEREGGDGILGSTALFGSVDTALMMRRRQDGTRTVESMQRYGEDMPPTVLAWDAETGTVEAGGTVVEVEMTRIAEAILEVLGDDWMNETQIRDAVGGNTGLVGKALRQMLKDEQVERQGAGKRGDAYRYRKSIPVSLFRNMDKREKQENEKTPDVLEVR